MMERTRSRNASSRATLGLSQSCTLQGFSLLLSRMRCTDCGEFDSTVPSAVSLIASCPQVHSDSERSALSGNSHASFTRCAATSGGKAGRTPAARLIDQPGKPVVLETFPPLVHNPAPAMKLGRDSRDGLAIGESQYNLRSHNIPVRRRQRPSAPFEFPALLWAQNDSDGCAPHRPTEQRPSPSGQLP